MNVVIAVSMPSRAYTSFLQLKELSKSVVIETDVSMPSRAYTSFLQTYHKALKFVIPCVNALSGLYLISTMDITAILGNIGRVSMPSRAYTSFLRYPFKNLGFMRFPEPVFAGIYQNILTAAVFRAC